MDRIETSCTELVFHMNGITLNEAWTLSPLQRNKMVAFLNKIYKDRAEAASGKKNM